MKKLILFMLFLGVLALNVNADVPEGYYLYFEDDFSTDENRDYWMAQCESWGEADFCGWDSESESFNIFNEAPLEYTMWSRLYVKTDTDYGDIYEFTVDFSSTGDSNNCSFGISLLFFPD